MRLGETRELRFIYQVSIHASVKDATQLTKAQAEYTSVSIHASVKDATTDLGRITPVFTVSIHASVKDATKLMLWLLALSWFQSTHL